MNWLRRPLLYARTVRHLKLRQIRNQLWRRLRPQRVPGPAPQPLQLSSLQQPRVAFLLPPVPSGVVAGQIAFVGITRPFNLPHPDWQASDSPKLWRYNLHYFDFLHWPVFSPADKDALVNDWIARVPAGSGDGWEPYPLSLRTVNWLKHLLARQGRAYTGEVPAGWLASLGQQLEALHHDVEHHLLANHLYKNAKALVMGGMAFSGPAAEAWLQHGLGLLLAETDEQFLPDGGHIERSAMYHCIVLEDVLDVLNWDSICPGRLPLAARERLAAAALRATRFLDGIRGGDGEIPLFNDAALGITRPAVDILDYAAAVPGTGVLQGSGADGRPVRIEFPHTGYFGYRAGGDSLLIDCGPGGPDYQPGHMHADLLSYELCLDGERVVVDSGTYDYETTPFRAALRGTAAHNTVRVDGQDQTELWGAFRVARRARPLHARLSLLEDGRLVFEGAHDGYRRLPGCIVHERRITASLAGTWEVADRITGAGEHLVESYINLHPACSVEAAGDGSGAPDGSGGPRKQYLVRREGRPVLRITVRGEAAVELRKGAWCPEFGLRYETTVVVLVRRGELPLEFGYRFERA